MTTVITLGDVHAVADDANHAAHSHGQPSRLLEEQVIAQGDDYQGNDRQDHRGQVVHVCGGRGKRTVLKLHAAADVLLHHLVDVEERGDEHEDDEDEAAHPAGHGANQAGVLRIQDIGGHDIGGGQGAGHHVAQSGAQHQHHGHVSLRHDASSNADHSEQGGEGIHTHIVEDDVHDDDAGKANHTLTLSGGVLTQQVQQELGQRVGRAGVNEHLAEDSAEQVQGQ